MRSSALTLGFAVLLSGCVSVRPTRTPIPTRSFPGPPGNQRLLVLLPGRGDDLGAFERHAFINAARVANTPADIVVVDAHLGYYRARTVSDRLFEDVVRPARTKGVTQVWLAGISLGGLGSLIVAKEHPEAIDGIVLLAPYLGPDDLLDEIAAAGGLRQWHPRDSTGDFRPLWSWLKGYAGGSECRPQIYLAYGENDRLERAHRLLAAALPPDRVLTTRGGHDWRTWKRLWDDMLGHSVLFSSPAVPCSPPGPQPIMSSPAP